MRVALVTCRILPEPDPDEALLLEALRVRGVDPTLAAWDDPAVDWAGFDLAVLRSPWNYHRAPAAFLEWLARAAGASRLLNPAPLVRWNAHKGYLLDLEAAGFPVTPTELLRAGEDASLAPLLARRGWRDAVVKPAVSAGSHATLRVRADDPASLAAGEAHLARLLAAEDVLCQAYLASVEGTGERALVWIDGALTHAVRKRARFLGEDEAVEGPLPIADDERVLALALLEHARAARGGADLLYGRVDLARDAEGRPCLMELELIEPSLFLRQHPPAREALTDAIAARARGRG